ncbi:MAG: nickel pincer cofactor biosynthesis protein LarC [Planctomycetes bacterium]|nr:nickel pincer cofactor biosynthesis protein LarC [Planctomycetota bacterium]
MRVVYFDCFSGVAGDMILGALVDLGVSFEAWLEALQGIARGEFQVALETVAKGPIACRRVAVTVAEHAAPAHRRLADVLELLERSALPAAVQEKSAAVFRRLAAAEAAVHGCRPETVVFHEVGAVDAIVDIAGAVLALEMLRVDSVRSSPIALGRTFVATAHGELPTPAPATVELLTGVPVVWSEAPAELTTPTGAALVTTLGDGFGLPPAGRLLAAGYGAGGQDLPGRPNALRALLLDVGAPPGADRAVVLEANVDDMTPEHVGEAMPRLLEAGALDVFATPVVMKKGRPGLRLTVLAPVERRTDLAVRMLRETSTFGVRGHEVDRVLLARRFVEVATPWGSVRVKVGLLGDEAISAAPEHEDCARLARAAGLPMATVYSRALAAYHERAGDPPGATAAGFSETCLP